MSSSGTDLRACSSVRDFDRHIHIGCVLRGRCSGELMLGIDLAVPTQSLCGRW